jgi:anti-sigma factor RsiW
MKPCPESESLQLLLDGELDPREEARVRRHALECADCAEELALYERVFAELANAATWDPGPALTERVLDQVLPSRIRSRWMRALGWGYGAAVAASAAAVLALVSNPPSRHVLGALGIEASQRVAQAMMFVMDALALTLVRVAGGWTLVNEMGSRFVPILRAISTLLARPGVDLTLLTATLASGVLLWWLRPRRPQPQVRNQDIHRVRMFAL